MIRTNKKPKQFVFRQQYSTTDSLMYCSKVFCLATNKNQTAAAAFLYLRPNLPQKPKKIINLYLSNQQSNRLQETIVNNCESDWIVLSQGVPQGSLLGPLLFNPYYSDKLPRYRRHEKIQYADETMISGQQNN